MVQDHFVVGQRLAMLLGEAYEVVEIWGDGRRVPEIVQKLGPDVLLLDLHLPDRNGLEVLRDLAYSHPHLPILVVTTHGDHSTAQYVLREGARGLAPRNAGIAEIRTAIETLLKGGAYCSALLIEADRSKASGSSALTFLSKRERQVIEAIAAGKSTQDIARHYSLSPWTIHFHRKNIIRKLGLGSDHDLIRAAVELVNTHSGHVPPLLCLGLVA